MKPQNNTGKADKGSEKKLKEEIGKKMPFMVPDGYFDAFPQRVLETARKDERKSISFIHSRSFVLKLAAAAAILIFSTIFITRYFNTHEGDDDLLTEYGMKEVYLYNINQLSELEDAYLFSIIEDLDASLYSSEVAGDSISNELIMEYLLAENHIEYLTLTNY